RDARRETATGAAADPGPCLRSLFRSCPQHEKPGRAGLGSYSGLMRKCQRAYAPFDAIMATLPWNHTMQSDPPSGFEPLFRTSPFLETVGPLFYRRDPEASLVIGL